METRKLFAMSLMLLGTSTNLMADDPIILSDKYHDNENHRYVVVEHDDDDETVTVTSGITTTAQVVVTSGTGQVVYDKQTVISSSPVVIRLPETTEEQTYSIEIETDDSSLYGEFCQTVK